MKQIISSTLLALLACIFQSSAQSIVEQPDLPSVHALHIGDTVPPLIIDKLLQGSKTGKRSLADYRDKLLILDFWATTCSGCVAAMPRLDSVERLFGQQVTILPVSYESEATVRSFWGKNHLLKSLPLFSTAEDRLLAACFKHRVISHVVWIYHGVVSAVTGTEYVDETNIRDILSDKTVDWPEKRDMVTYDYNQPLVPQRKNIINYSAILGYQEGIDAHIGIVTDSVNRIHRGYLINMDPANAFFLLWSKVIPIRELKRPSFLFTPNQLILDVQHPEDYVFDRKRDRYLAAWERAHSLSFETLTSVDTIQPDKTIYRRMIREMNGLLGLSTGWERRKVICWVLRDAYKEAASIQPTGKQDIMVTPADLVYQLNNSIGSPPIFIETRQTNVIRLPVGFKGWQNLALLNNFLKKSGFQMEIEEREVDLLVIKEVK